MCPENDQPNFYGTIITFFKNFIMLLLFFLLCYYIHKNKKYCKLLSTHRTPDVIDFQIIKRISEKFIHIKMLINEKMRREDNPSRLLHGKPK